MKIRVKSTFSTLCGVLPRLGFINIDAEIQLKTQCLPELLHDFGYTSVFFDTNPQDQEYRFEFITQKLGIRDYYRPPILASLWMDVFLKPKQLLEDRYLLPASETWLSQRHDHPFLAIYNTITPHHPYALPDGSPRRPYAHREPYNTYLNTVYYLDDFFLPIRLSHTFRFLAQI